MNYSINLNPSYVDLVFDTYKAIRWHYRAETWQNYTLPNGFFKDLNHYFDFPLNEAYPIFLIGIFFTIARYAFEILFCKPLLKWLRVENKSDKEKFPESFWKFIVYSILWGLCANILLFNLKFDYLNQIATLWNDWELKMKIPNEIKNIYFLECGFYLHSIYGTIFMDTKRKDFAVMLIHHFLTIILIVISYGVKYHKVGIMVLFLHDVTDILLEFCKCNVHIKNRGGKFHAFNDHLSSVSIVLFTIVWFGCRLYLFPLKVLYASSVISVYIAADRGAGLYALCNSLLWFLLCLDIYWFYFILVFLYKVLTGQLKEVNDTRDFDEKEEKKNE